MIQIILILLIAIGMTVLVYLTMKHLEPERTKWFIWLCLAMYVLGNLYFTMFSRVVDSGTTVELRPFQTYLRFFETTEVDFENATGFAALFLKDISPITGIILNILLYYPFGYLLPNLFPNIKLKHVILIGCLCSIATEATQYIFKMGWCETDDVIHNTIGTAIGVWVWCLQSKRLNKHKPNELPKD